MVRKPVVFRETVTIQNASMPTISEPSPLPRLLQFAKRHWRMVVAQLVLAVLGTSLILVFPSVVQWFIDDIIPNKKLDQLYGAAGLAAGAFALREILFAFRTKLNTVFEQRMIFDLRGQLHRKVAHLPVGWFDKQSTGELRTKKRSDGIRAFEKEFVLSYSHTSGNLTEIRILQPPLNILVGFVCISTVNPRPNKIRRALDSAASAPMLVRASTTCC